MASAKLSFKSTSKKRDRQVSSTSEGSSTSSSPPYKKSYESTLHDTLDTQVTKLKTFHEKSVNMEFLADYMETEDESMPIWAKHMYAKICDMAKIQKDSKRMLDSLVKDHKLFEGRLEGVITLAMNTNKEVDLLKNKVETLTVKVEVLDNKVNNLENYSKKYNVKIFNMRESPNEDSQVLLQKLSEIMSNMDLDIKRFYIDNIHRLPSNISGPRPVIVKFISILDKSLFWSRINRLEHTDLYFREHFCSDTERNIQTLLPIRKAALQNKLKVRMSADKLYIENTKYHVGNLANLPEILQPSRFGSRVINDKLFFFSRASPLSNFHPSPFMVDGKNFNCGEQYIQWSKAVLFGCNTKATDILKASTPAHMKKIGSSLPNFSASLWKSKIPDIADTCLQNKFEQNRDLRQYLVNTGNKKLYEAAPRDPLWGIGLGMYDPHLLSKEKEWGSNMMGTALVKVRRKYAN